MTKTLCPSATLSHPTTHTPVRQWVQVGGHVLGTECQQQLQQPWLTAARDNTLPLCCTLCAWEDVLSGEPSAQPASAPCYLFWLLFYFIVSVASCHFGDLFDQPRNNSTRKCSPGTSQTQSKFGIGARGSRIWSGIRSAERPWTRPSSDKIGLFTEHRSDSSTLRVRPSITCIVPRDLTVNRNTITKR